MKFGHVLLLVLLITNPICISNTQSRDQRLDLSSNIWDKVLKNGPNKICGRQSLSNLKGYGLLNWSN